MFHSFLKAVQLQVHWNLVLENHVPEKQQPRPLGICHMGPSSCLQRKKKRAGDVLCRARSWTPMILRSAFQLQLFYDSTSAVDSTGLTEAHLLFWTSVRPEWGVTLRRAQAHTPQALHRTESRLSRYVSAEMGEGKQAIWQGEMLSLLSMALPLGTQLSSSWLHPFPFPQKPGRTIVVNFFPLLLGFETHVVSSITSGCFNHCYCCAHTVSYSVHTQTEYLRLWISLLTNRHTEKLSLYCFIRKLTHTVSALCIHVSQTPLGACFSQLCGNHVSKCHIKAWEMQMAVSCFSLAHLLLADASREDWDFKLLEV